MAGMQFEYDEKGGTFYYFLLSFLALILFPASYYLWPRGTRKEDPENERKKCRCPPCLKKQQRLNDIQPYENAKKFFIKVTLTIGWIIFLLVAYKASQVELDWTEFDPFKELEIDREASIPEIKKAYRKLSLIHHPDRGGDPKRFMRITRAHAALTDEEARNNWLEYGNPDGPGATRFGIALPKWIVEEQNSVLVLGLYGLVFIVILPIVVGTWWYRSIKFSAEQILMDTKQLYYSLFYRTPNMVLKRVIMVLGGSFEFEKHYNNEIVERPTDNEEIPNLMRELSTLNEKNKGAKPLCYPYSVKARTLLYSHFYRKELPPNTLDLDRQYMLRKCPFLLSEMVNIVSHLVGLANSNSSLSHMPRLNTIENCMKLCQMVTQAQWDNKSPLLQLPHITEDMLRHFSTRKRNIRSIHDFVIMKDEDRRSLLRNFGDGEMQDIMNVCAAMPYINMAVRTEVMDDEDRTITAGSIVTVTVILNRQNMGVLFNKNYQTMNGEMLSTEDNFEEDEDQKIIDDVQQASDSPVKKQIKGWEKTTKKKKGKGEKLKKKPGKLQLKTVALKKNVLLPQLTNVENQKLLPNADSLGPDADATTNGTVAQKSSVRNPPGDQGDSSNDESADEDVGESGNDTEQDDEEKWKEFQEEAKKETSLETKSRETHLVHCPYFPGVKYEWWWLYVADRKNQILISAPVYIRSLKEEEEIQVKFPAPSKPGVYQYSVILRSDSYIDFDQVQSVKLDVKEAKKVEDHPQWNISDDEEDRAADGNESESGSDYDYDESEDD